MFKALDLVLTGRLNAYPDLYEKIKIMKKLIMFLAVLTAPFLIYAQDDPVYHPKENYYTLGDAQHLIGFVQREEVSGGLYKEWFDKNYGDFEVRSVDKKMIRKGKNLKVKVVYGTWCGDSKRGVPRLLKILDSWNFDEDQVEYLAVSNRFPNYKCGLNGEEKGLNVHRVPTFIFYDGEKEVGRIVERPVTDLVTDVAQIFSGLPTAPSYNGVANLISFMETKTKPELDEMNERIVNFYKYHIHRSSELNGLGYSWLSQGRNEDALYVLKLNTQLFPKVSNTFDSLGEAYFHTKQFQKAKIEYDKVLELDPENEGARTMLDKINNKIASNL